MPQPKGLEPGVYVNLSMDDYHNDPAIGSGGIKKLIKSPESYWFDSALNPDREPYDTAAFKVGRAYHSMVLEPDKLFPFEIKKGVKTSKVEGMIGEGDYYMLMRMLKRLMENPRHWNALHGGLAEVSIFWRDEATGLMCKIRPDNFAPEWVGDLKTTTSVDSSNLRHDFVKMGYHISGAMYSEGMNALKKMIADGYVMPPEFTEEFVAKFTARKTQMFCFVFQEKTTKDGKPTPNTSRLWNMTPYAAELGYEKFVKGLHIYHENQHNTGPWPSGYPDVEDITEDMVSQAINY